jgi:hypothetical protein
LKHCPRMDPNHLPQKSACTQKLPTRPHRATLSLLGVGRAQKGGEAVPKRRKHKNDNINAKYMCVVKAVCQANATCKGYIRVSMVHEQGDGIDLFVLFPHASLNTIRESAQRHVRITKDPTAIPLARIASRDKARCHEQVYQERLERHPPQSPADKPQEAQVRCRTYARC